MHRAVFLIAPFVFSLANASAASSTEVLGRPCWIEDASAKGETVWLLCQDGGLLRTADGGSAWAGHAVPASGKLRGIAFLDARRGFVVGDAGTLLATGDGGENWRPVETPATDRLTAIHFVGELGWAAGMGGMMLHTKDGGKTWRRQITGTTQPLEDVYFADPQHGWAVGWVGTILRTTDGGAVWREVRSEAAQWSLNAVYFRGTKDGWAAGFGGQILRTRDGGETWQALASPVRGTLTSILFDRAGGGWIAGDSHLLHSGDGGETWRVVPVEGSPFLSRVLAVGEAVWAVGPFSVVRQAGGGWKEFVPRAGTPPA